MPVLDKNLYKFDDFLLLFAIGKSLVEFCSFIFSAAISQIIKLK